MNGDGTLTYTPLPDFHGVDSFAYRVSDPGGQLDEAVVSVTVTSDGLLASDDASATDEDTAVSIPVSDLLLNDSSGNVGGTLTVASTDAVSSQGAAVSPPYGRNCVVRSLGVQLASAFGCRRCRGRYDPLYTRRRNWRQRSGHCFAITITGANDAPVANDDLAVIGYRIQTVDAPGATSTSILGINNHGIVLGTFSDAAGGHIFTYDGTTFTQIEDDLYALALAQGITSSRHSTRDQ